MEAEQVKEWRTKSISGRVKKKRRALALGSAGVQGSSGCIRVRVREASRYLPSAKKRTKWSHVSGGQRRGRASAATNRQTAAHPQSLFSKA